MDNNRRSPGYLLGSVSVVILVMGLASVAVSQNIAWRWEQHRRYVDTQTEAQLAASAKAILTEAVRWEADPTESASQADGSGMTWTGANSLRAHTEWSDLNGVPCENGYVGDCWRLQTASVTELEGRLNLEPKALTMTVELGVGCVFLPTASDPAQQCDLRGNTEVRLTRAVVAPFQLHLADQRPPVAAGSAPTVFLADTELAHLSLAEPAVGVDEDVYYCDPHPPGGRPGFRVEGSVEAHIDWRWVNVCPLSSTSRTLANASFFVGGDRRVVDIGQFTWDGAVLNRITEAAESLEHCVAPCTIGLSGWTGARAVYVPAPPIPGTAAAEISGVTDESFVLVARGDIVIDVSSVTTFGIDELRVVDPDAEPPVIALISLEGDVVLKGSMDATLNRLAVVALSAGKGIYAEEWANSTIPPSELTFVGAIATNRNPVFGIGSTTGQDSGFEEVFTYPDGFESSVVPWWPFFDQQGYWR